MKQLCSFCGTLLSEAYVLCVTCEPKCPICVRCFAKGSESSTHQNDHPYTIVRTDFPVISNSWTGTEELRLLDAILDHGIGNWSDIAKQVAGKTAKECESHFLHHYIYASNHELGDVMPVPSYENECCASPVFYEVSGDPPRPVLCSQQQVDMAGYMAARGDFSFEFDNYAELDVAELDFATCEDQADKDLQVEVLRIYRSRLLERARRKWIIRKHGLLSQQRNRQFWRRYSATLGEHTCSVLIRFMQLLPPEDFDFLIEGLHGEQLLKQQMKLLQESRSVGLIRTNSIHLYKQCSRWRMSHHTKRVGLAELLNNMKNEKAAHVWLHKQLIKDSSTALDLRKPLGRKMAPPLDITGLPGFEKLTNREKELCASLRLVPDMYLNFKTMLINEYQKLGSLRLANARAIIKIDVNKTRKIYDLLLSEGLVKKGFSL
uniref:Putative transcriptional adaptor n=1 Tax=Ornithodoros turicata TaxID=34597 RepID=A0A2R5LAT1_9ACAR